MGRRLGEAAFERHSELPVQEARGASWRGWLAGLLAVAAVSVFIPYSDLILQGTNLSWNAFPMISVTLTLALVLLCNVLFSTWRTRLGLRREDLTLIFCMTMECMTASGADCSRLRCGLQGRGPHGALAA